MDYMPFNSVSNDRVYKAEDWAWYFSTFISNGVFAPYNGHTACNVTANNTMGLTVAEGFAFINGYAFHNTGANLTVSTAHATLPRIDRVVIRWDLNSRLISVALKAGTAATNPSAPALTRSSTVYELALADIYVDAGATGISQAKVTDRRPNTSLCGFVTGVIDQIDWTTLTAQLEGYMSDVKDSMEAWVATLHGVLDTQTASHLLRLIQDVEKKADWYYGSGAGAANSHVYKEEIDEVTDDMYAAIDAGSFYNVHVGMHYTAPSGRSYYFADADYFYRHKLSINGSYQTMTEHHMLVIEDEVQHYGDMNLDDTNAGGAADSRMYTHILPSYQSELEADFGASHIISAPICLPYTPSNPVQMVSKDAFLLNSAMVWGNFPLPTPTPSTSWRSYHASNRIKQLSLFKSLPEAIVAPGNGEDSTEYWLDDVCPGDTFASVYNCYPIAASPLAGIGIRRAFLIGNYAGGNSPLVGTAITGYVNI